MVIDIIFIAVIVFGIIYTLMQSVFSWHLLRKKSANGLIGIGPGITVFKPLKGVDDNLEENLRSFFTQDYNQYQLLFGLSDKRDPAAAIVRKLRGEYPNIKSKLVISGETTGLNPKINNLINMYSHSRHPYLLISDSNVRVKQDYLKEMMGALQQDGVGLVTSTIRGVGAKSTGATMENLHLNTFIAGSVYIAEHLAKMPIAIGKSMLMARTTLETIGGFPAFRNLLAEDYLIGESIEAIGMRVTTITSSIDNVNRSWSMKRFCNRHVRWAKIRKAINPAAYILECTANPVAVAAVYTLLQPDEYNAVLLAATALLKIALDYGTASLQRTDLPLWKFLLVPVKDLLIGAIWYLPFINSRVIWRGNEFKICRNTVLKPVKSSLIEEEKAA